MEGLINKYIQEKLILMGVSRIIIRKLVSAVMTCVLVMLSFFFVGQTAFAIIVGMYLLPILLIYGVPASILSDFVTKKLGAFLRGFTAFFMHLFLASLFVVIPTLFSEWERDLLLSDIRSLFYNFYFIISLLSSSLFYCIDEFLRSKLAKYLYQKIFLSNRVKDLCEKIGDLRI
ncbi:hypothetical protein KD050_01215 [Psychrobacillus sp. INOP01]|uniref:hypothetical protein n=1 Tax=Psychrobacillus sp. INOP01 TaxID=2829187 RepID=UPI001BACED24|nr:hypothetical protein [Psychrobacillus sp. INOP01]QUG41950.1 hypothetical protein KD050_01215 [Psychrobacillus sp. INOP01]